MRQWRSFLIKMIRRFDHAFMFIRSARDRITEGQLSVNQRARSSGVCASMFARRSLSLASRSHSFAWRYLLVSPSAVNEARLGSADAKQNETKLKYDNLIRDDSPRFCLLFASATYGSLEGHDSRNSTWNHAHGRANALHYTVVLTRSTDKPQISASQANIRVPS